MGTPFSQCFYQRSGRCASAVVRQHLTASKKQTSMCCYQWNMADLRTRMSCFLNCTFTSPSSLDPSHSGNPPPPTHTTAPSPGPSGLLGPQGPCELPTKVHNAIQTIDQRTKSTFTQVEPSLKAKRHCLEGFQTPPTPTPPYHRHPTQPPCQHPTPQKKERKKHSRAPFPPPHPTSQFLSFKKKKCSPFQ